MSAAGLAVAAGGLLGAAALLYGARAAVFRAFSIPRVPLRRDPGRYGLDFRDVTIPTANDRTLGAWFVPPARAPGPCVVVMHGWGANAAMMLPLVAPIAKAGLGLVLVDARNHGRSDGDTYASMPRFAEDVDACLDWLRDQPEADGARLGLLGHSVGAAACLLAASRRDDVAAVAALATFDHPERVMRDYLRHAGLPWRPLGWLVTRYVEKVIGHRFEAIAPLTTIRRVRCPVLLLHGEDDPVISVEQARAVHARANGNARLVTAPGVDHEARGALRKVQMPLRDFLKEVLGP